MERHVQQSFWNLFAEIALKVTQYKMTNNRDMKPIEIKIFHMSKEELSNSEDSEVIDYINEVAKPEFVFNNIDSGIDYDPYYAQLI